MPLADRALGAVATADPTSENKKRALRALFFLSKAALSLSTPQASFAEVVRLQGSDARQIKQTFAAWGDGHVRRKSPTSTVAAQEIDVSYQDS